MKKKYFLKWILIIPILPFYSIWHIWKKTNWEKKTKIWSTVGISIATIIFLAFGNVEDPNAAKDNEKTNKIKEEKIEKPAEKPKTKEEIEKNLIEEKARLEILYATYELNHLSLWQDTVDKMKQGNINETYVSAQKLSEALALISYDLTKQECKITGDNAFDDNICPITLGVVKRTYTQKEKAIYKLMKYMENTNNPKLYSEAKAELDMAGEMWKVYGDTLKNNLLSEEKIKK